jgi:ABC-type branched-subunit amino acid transport system substrate-binding protein
MSVLVSLGVAAAALTTTALPGSAGASAPSQQFPPVDQPGVTSTEIKVGGVVSKTNPLGGEYASAFDGVKAYFNMVNASKDKGIYGRKLTLSSERDDQLANNRQEAQALLSEDNVFAVLPVASLLFTGADVLGQSGVPTFGWNINAEWGSEQAPGPPNLFGEKGSFLCFTCANALGPLFAKTIKAKKIGVLAYTVPQSADCAKGVQASFQKYPSAKIEVIDTSLSFGVTDVSGPVSEMKDKGVDLVTTCMDNNGTLTVAKEMKKQGLNAIQYLPNSYNQKFIQENAQFFQGSYALTFFTPFEVQPKPKGLTNFQKWMKKGGFEQNENAMSGWISADMFYQGLKAAGPDFTRQKVIDAVNANTDYTANGLLGGINWQLAHSQQEPNGCVVLSKIENGKFKPAFGQRGKPFVCYPNQPDKLPAKFVPAAGVAGFGQ